MLEYALHLSMILFGVIAVILLWRQGCLSPSAFDEAPRRKHGLIPEDLLVGIAVLALSQLLALVTLHFLGLAPLDGQPPPVKDTLTRSLELLILQVIGTVPVVVFILVQSWRRSDEGWRGLGITRFSPIRDGFIGLAAFMAAVWICFGLGSTITLVVKLFQSSVPEIGHSVLNDMFTSDSMLAVVIISISAVLIAPVVEEIIYRGLLQSSLMAMVGQQRRWTVIIVGALIFAAVHAAVAEPVALPTLFVLGVILGWVYERTGSLWPCVGVHAGFNAINIGVVLSMMIWGTPA